MKENDKNAIKLIHEIMTKVVGSELRDLHDKYGFPREVVDAISATLYIKSDFTEKWKGGNTKFVKIFETECNLLLKSKKIDFRELGFLTFLAVNFTNYEDNTLRNKDGSACTQKDIILESNMSRTIISSLMRTLVEKKLLFERKNLSIVNGKAYLLNPMLFYRGSNMDKRRTNLYKQIKNEIISVWEQKESEEILRKYDDVINKTVESIVDIEKEVLEEYYKKYMDDAY